MPKEESIFQKVLKTGDSKGNLKSLESEIMEKRLDLKEGFSGADKKEAERVRKYLTDIFGISKEYSYLFVS